MTMAEASLNKYDFYSIKDVFGSWGALCLTLYLLFISIAAVNLFITMLNVFLEETGDDPTAMKDESEVIDHLVGIVKSFVTSDSKGKDNEKEEDNDSKSVVADNNPDNYYTKSTALEWKP